MVFVKTDLRQVKCYTVFVKTDLPQVKCCMAFVKTDVRQVKCYTVFVKTDLRQVMCHMAFGKTDGRVYTHSHKVRTPGLSQSRSAGLHISSGLHTHIFIYSCTIFVLFRGFV